MRETYRTRSEEETIALGETLAARLGPRSLVLLIGGLGAGKTTIAKGIVKGLGAAHPDAVSSPTFTLVHEYGDPPAVYHVDLYRLDERVELDSLGLDEILDRDAVVLVEWGDRFASFWPEDRFEIELRRVDGEEREIEVRRLPEAARR